MKCKNCKATKIYSIETTKNENYFKYWQSIRENYCHETNNEDNHSLSSPMRSSQPMCHFKQSLLINDCIKYKKNGIQAVFSFNSVSLSFVINQFSENSKRFNIYSDWTSIFSWKSWDLICNFCIFLHRYKILYWLCSIN